MFFSRSETAKQVTVHDIVLEAVHNVSSRATQHAAARCSFKIFYVQTKTSRTTCSLESSTHCCAQDPSPSLWPPVCSWPLSCRFFRRPMFFSVPIPSSSSEDTASVKSLSTFGREL